MEITDERIDRTAQAFFAARTDEKKLAAEKKLLDLLINSYVNKDEKNISGEALMQRMSNDMEKIEKGGKAQFHSEVFMESFRDVCKGYSEEKGSFIHYFRNIYARRLQGKGAEAYLQKEGINLKAADIKNMRELRRIIKDYAKVNVDFAGKDVKSLSVAEVKEVCEYYFGDNQKRCIALQKLCFDYCQMQSVRVDNRDEDEENNVPDIYLKSSEQDAFGDFWQEENLNELRHVFREIYDEATDTQKMYFSCFNCAKVVQFDILSHTMQDSYFVEWALLDFVSELRHISKEEIESISDADIARYREVKPAAVSKQHKKYDEILKTYMKRFLN